MTLVCFKLHNFILSNCGSFNVPPPYQEDALHNAKVLELGIDLQDEYDMDSGEQRTRRDLESSDILDLFTQEIEDGRLRRPNA